MEEKDSRSHGEIPKEVFADLDTGVANMAVNPQAAGGQPTRSHLEKV
jgi:hypothetical protein